MVISFLLDDSTFSMLHYIIEVLFAFKNSIFSIKRNIIRVPMLVPGLEYTFETLVECISDMGISDQIRVFVLRDSFPPNVLTAGSGGGANSTHQQQRGSKASSKTVTANESCQSKSSQPLISALINMPVAEAV